LDIKGNLDINFHDPFGINEYCNISITFKLMDKNLLQHIMVCYYEIHSN